MHYLNIASGGKLIQNGVQVVCVGQMQNQL